MSDDDLIGPAYRRRMKISRLIELLAKKTDMRCSHCGQGDMFVEPSVDDPEVAFAGGFVAPDLSAVAPCFVLTCRTCATMRPISIEIVDQWGGKNG